MGACSSDINTTPLIDVLLVLLVILILSVPPMAHRVGLTLPSGPARQPVAEKVDIEVDIDGQVYWNGRQVASMGLLEDQFHAFKVDRGPLRFIVYPDRRARGTSAGRGSAGSGE